MFAQPPFPGTAALKRESEAQRNKFRGVSTDNLQLSSSPRYNTRPIRFSVYVTPFVDQTVFVNIPDIHFPPHGSMMIELESVTHKAGDEPYLYVESLTDYVDTCNGFVVRTRNLADPAFLHTGIQRSDTFFKTKDGRFYNPVPSPQEVLDLTNQTDIGGKKIDSRNTVDTSTVSQVFSHTNLQFAFDVSAESVDAGGPEWFPAIQFDKKLEMTFLLYPNPYWQQSY